MGSISQSSWTHLVRIKHKGIPTFAHLVNINENGDLPEQIEVKIAKGDPVYNDIVVTEEKVTVGRNTLLAPFATVPIVINTGLNYKDHVTESLFYSTPVSITEARFFLCLTSRRICLLLSHTSFIVRQHRSPTLIPLFLEHIRYNKNV